MKMENFKVALSPFLYFDFAISCTYANYFLIIEGGVHRALYKLLPLKARVSGV